MNRYGTLAHGPVDRDQERLLHELFVEQAPAATTTTSTTGRRPTLLNRVRRTLAALLHPRPSSAALR